MIVTADILAEQILRIVTGGNLSQDEKLDIREVKILVNQQIAWIAKKNYLEGKNLESISFVDGQFISAYKNVKVFKDTERDEWYSLMPATAIAFPRTSGVLQVSAMKGHQRPFYPIQPTTLGMFSHLEAFSTCDKYYYVEGDKVYFPEDPETPKVLIKLVGQGDAMIPEDYQFEIITNVLKVLGIEKQVQQDKVPDGVSN